MESAWTSSGLGLRAKVHERLVPELVRLNNDPTAWYLLRDAMRMSRLHLKRCVHHILLEKDTPFVRQLTNALWVLGHSDSTLAYAYKVGVEIKDTGLDARLFQRVLFEIAGKKIDLDWPPVGTFHKLYYFDPFQDRWVRAPEFDIPVPTMPITPTITPLHHKESESMNAPFTAPAAPAALSNKAFETRHYVYGFDVNNMSEAQLIDAIKRIESEIKDLSGIEVKSTRITAKVSELKAMLKKVVEVLDAK